GGKGAVAVLAAERLGCHTQGVDGYGPFIRSARELATREGVSDRCTFRVGDVSESDRAGRARLFDAAIMLNVFPCGRAARILRRWVRPGGVYVLDDAFRAGRAPAGVRPLPTLAGCRAAIEVNGDTIEAELVPAPAAV